MGTLRDRIIAVEDLPRAEVLTPEWEPEVPSVWVRGLSGSERDTYEQSLTERGPDGRVRSVQRMKNLRASFVAMTMIDPANGLFVFDPNKKADVEALGKKSGLVLDRIWTKAREISGMTVEEEEEESPFVPVEPNSSGSVSLSESPDPDWLAQRVSGKLLGEWGRYEIEYGPILVQDRIDYAAALIAMWLARDPNRSQEDFLPKWGPERPESEEALVAKLKAFATDHAKKKGDDE